MSRHVSPPPGCLSQKSLGDLHVEIGAFASAMEVFDRLCLWEPLIVCSHRAGRSGKVRLTFPRSLPSHLLSRLPSCLLSCYRQAEEIIRQRLAVKETPVLYCSLSDVTNDPQFYHKAWELSGHRSARAMRGLAFYHLRACEVCSSVRQLVLAALAAAPLTRSFHCSPCVPPVRRGDGLL